MRLIEPRHPNRLAEEVIVSKRSNELMSRLTPQERAGAIAEIELPAGMPIPRRPPQAMLGEVREALAVRAIGEALARARKQAGLQAKELAVKLEVSAPRVAQVEASDANLTLATVLEHAQASGCEVEIVLRPHDPKLPLITASLMGLAKSSSRRKVRAAH